MSPRYEPTERTELNRLRHKAEFEAEAVHAILDTARVGTLAWADAAGQPFALPIAYVRDGGRLLFHGSTGAGAAGVGAGTTGAAVMPVFTVPLAHHLRMSGSLAFAGCTVTLSMQ